LTVGGMSAGLASGQKVIGPVTTTGTNTVGEIIDANLANGDNTFQVPSGATSVAIFLGHAPTATVKVRTNLNLIDGGLAIAPFTGTPWFKMDLVSGVTELILNANASVAAIELSFI
jgi:hypothetical protein